MMWRIITHAGKAHRDDFLACCILLARHPDAELFRGNPTAHDLDSATVFCVDVGGRYDASLNNFDHHQLPRDAPPTCAMMLVLEKFFGNKFEMIRAASPWLDFTALLDSKGPTVAAKSLGLDRKQFAAIQSPIESQVLQLFADCANDAEKWPLVRELMVMIGRQYYEYWRDFADRWWRLLGEAHEFSVGDVVCLDVTFIAGNANPTLALEQFCLATKDHVVITVTCDDRGDGFTLFRRNDDPRVDFSRLAEQHGVIFAHKNGFIAKLAAGVTILPLIEAAII